MANTEYCEQEDNVHDQIFQSGSDAWFNTGMNDLGDESGWTENGNIDMTGNGLYWFWDATWGDHRS